MQCFCLETEILDGFEEYTVGGEEVPHSIPDTAVEVVAPRGPDRESARPEGGSCCCSSLVCCCTSPLVGRGFQRGSWSRGLRSFRWESGMI